MNDKRKVAEKEALELINDLDPSGLNGDMWKLKFSRMSDKDFDTFMKQIYENTYKTHFSVDIEQTHNKTDTMIDISHIEKVAKKHKIKLREYVAFPHMNPDDPDNPFVTATPVPIFVMYVRKMQQFLQHKNFTAGNTDHSNPLTGQVTGESKAAQMSDMQTAALITTGQKDTIREMLTIRADNLPAKVKMLEQIDQYGRVNYSDCNVNINDSQSLQTLRVFMQAACLKSKVLSSKNKKI